MRPGKSLRQKLSRPGPRARAMVFGAGDQAVVSLASFLFLVIAARYLDTAELGLFAGAMVFYQALTAMARSVTGEPLVVLCGDKSGGSKGNGDNGNGHNGNGDNDIDTGDLRRAVVWVSLIVPLILAVLGGIGFAVIDNRLVQICCLCLVVSPIILGYDTLRFVYISRLDTASLLLLDVVVAIAQLSLLAATLAGGGSADQAILVMFAAPVVPLVIHLIRGGLPLHPLRRWVTTARPYLGSFFYESVWGALLQWALVFVIAAVSGVADVAAFRSVIVIYGLTNVVTNYLRSVVLSHIVTRGRLTRADIGTDTIGMTATIAVTIGTSMLILLMLPDSLGRALLGDTWAHAAPFILIGGLARFSAAMEAVPGVLVRAARQTWSVVRVRTMVGALALIVCPLGAWLGSVTGAFVAMIVMSWVLIASLFALLFSRVPGGAPASPPSPEPLRANRDDAVGRFQKSVNQRGSNHASRVGVGGHE